MQSRVLPMLQVRAARYDRSTYPLDLFSSALQWFPHLRSSALCSDEVSVLMISRSETFLFRSCCACPTTLRSLLLHTPVGPAPAADAWFFSRDVDVLLLLQRLKLMIAPLRTYRVAARRCSPRMPRAGDPSHAPRDVVQSPLRSLSFDIFGRYRLAVL